MSPLPARELEFLRWISAGKRDSEIAQLMQVSVSTVRLYAWRVKNKLGASTNAGLVATAIRRGLIT